MIFRFSFFFKNLIQKILDFEYIFFFKILFRRLSSWMPSTFAKTKKTNFGHFSAFRRVFLVIKFKFSRFLQNRSEPELNEKRLRFYFLREVQRFHPEVWIENWWAKCYKIENRSNFNDFLFKTKKIVPISIIFHKISFSSKIWNQVQIPEGIMPNRNAAGGAGYAGRS